MPDTKISDEVAASTLQSADIFPLVQSSVNKKASIGQIAAFASTPTGIVNFTSAGGFNFTVPEGVFAIRQITCIGGGGAGGWGPPAGCASGGSAGATGVKYGVPVTPGQVISGIVGNGGAGVGSGTGNAGGDSNITIGSTTYTAPGGPGGLSSSSNSCNSPGVAGTPSNFDESFIGGQGNVGIFIAGTVVSGQGGNAQLGGNGGVGGGGVPGSGAAPGGGGGGTGSGAGTSGSGGGGIVRLIY